MRAPFLLSLAALALAPMLSGCLSLAPKPPLQLLTLQAAEAPPPGQTVSSATAHTLSLEVPVTPAAVAAPRVMVMTGADSVAYVKGAVWSEAPARLFARLLSDTVAARTGRIILSSSQALGDPGAHLSGELRSFGIDERKGEAVVVYIASLRRGADRIYETRRFEGRAAIGKINENSVGPALNRAANQVAADVADWVGK